MFLIVTTNLANKGGIERESLDAYNCLKDLGYQVDLLSPFRNSNKRFVKIFSRITFIFNLLITIPRSKLVLVMHAKLLTPVRLICLLVNRKAKLICWIHGIEVWGKEYNLVKNHLIKVDGMIADSYFTLDTMRKIGYQIETLKVVHPMASLMEGNKENLYINKDLKLLTVARIDQTEDYKGHKLILSALSILRNEDKKYRNIKWTIIGNGSGVENLKEKIQEVDLNEQIVLLGFVSDEKLKEEYLKCSVFIMPSPYGLKSDGYATGEGFGIVYLEAAFAGKASIGCLQGGQSDFILNNKTGWLINSSEAELVELLKSIYDNNHMLLELGNAAKERANLFFSKNNFNKDLTSAISYFLANDSS